MRLVFSGHALERMFQRAIAPREVRLVVDGGETIEEYPDDSPFPSRLMLGWAGDRPLHVVVAVDKAGDAAHVVTAHVPDPALWQPGFRTRKQP